MATPEEVVARYRAMPFGTDALGDCAENDAKVKLLAELDDHANAEVVAQLLLDVLSATDEFDLARIEVAKIVGIYINDQCPLERQLKNQLWHIVCNTDDDTLVRQHASQHIEIGFGGADEQQQVERLLFDDDDDTDVRHGAFSYLKSTPDVSFAHNLVPRLRAHSYWQEFDGALTEIAAR
jgi:hypothetical protein